jgi:hypothetical protein
MGLAQTWCQSYTAGKGLSFAHQPNVAYRLTLAYFHSLCFCNYNFLFARRTFYALFAGHHINQRNFSVMAAAASTKPGAACVRIDLVCERLVDL